MIRAMSMRRAPESLWRSRSYLSIWVAATVSNLGSMLHGLALPFLAIDQIGASPGDLALIRVSAVLPGLLFGLVAATWVDRLPKRALLIAMDLGRAIVVLWVPIAAWSGTLDLLQLCAVSALLGFMEFIFEAAQQAVLPRIVPPDQLVEANSKLRAASATTESLAFAAGGWLVQIFGAASVIAADAISFLASALALIGVRPTEQATPAESKSEQRSIWLETGEGLRFVLRHPVLAPLAISAALMQMAWSAVGPVYLVFVYRELGFEPGVLGMVFAIGGVSSVVGAVFCTRISRWLGAGRTLVLGSALFAASIAVVPFAPSAGAVGLALLVLNQLGDGFEVLFDVNQRSLRQILTPEPLLGRVSGAIQVAGAAAMLLGVVLGGLLGETVGTRATLGVAAGVVGLAALVIAFSPARRQPGDALEFQPPSG